MMITSNFQLWSRQVLPAVCRVGARVRSKKRREAEHGTIISMCGCEGDCPQPWLVRWDDLTEEWCAEDELRSPRE